MLNLSTKIRATRPTP